MLLTRLRLTTLLTRLLLAAALLLLTGLLVGVLGLLARIWGLVAHSGSPLLNTSLNQPGRRQLVAREQRFRLRGKQRFRLRGICVDGLASRWQAELADI